VTRCRYYFSSRRRHTSVSRDWSSDVCSSDLHEELTDGFHLVIDAMKLNGIDTIYNVPGIPITDLGRMAQAEGIRVLSCRHEQNRSEERRGGKECTARSSLDRAARRRGHNDRQ